eukprot:CAMPEP_0182801406 /NCGR_PEP_ID=MMETSP0006_2-20121128/2935_1 /TAXON_ID=97485 /ORGANISM="Prymnesium parvum, Strain Texoma1" /LENGTH=100 /DNA_ID=CAMNT_0024926725 /DNA_START=461 /DNA_END=763 /DNA_ORIENTATION=-
MAVELSSLGVLGGGESLGCVVISIVGWRGVAVTGKPRNKPSDEFAEISVDIIVTTELATLALSVRIDATTVSDAASIDKMMSEVRTPFPAASASLDLKRS